MAPKKTSNSKKAKKTTPKKAEPAPAPKQIEASFISSSK